MSTYSTYFKYCWYRNFYSSHCLFHKIKTFDIRYNFCIIKISKNYLFFGFIDILLIKTGASYGNEAGGDVFNDAQDCTLSFQDKIVSINAGWTSDVLDYITFLYSNGKSQQHGRETYRYSPYTSQFDLDSGETINSVTVYEGTRLIDNPYAPNGTYLVIGLRFYTNNGRFSQLFGSSNGTEINETFPTFSIAYARGKSYGYLDAIQFIWYNMRKKNSNLNI